ncbi:MAG: PIN/TRAM domain-containing protein [Verrucomicrobiia bacterium]
MSVWIIRIFFLSLCTLAGYAVSQSSELGLIESGWQGILLGFGFGGLLIAIDEMVKGFSLRAFSAATFGLFLGTFIAWLIDNSGLFAYVEEKAVMWVIRLGLFLGFGYLGMVLALRSNKEDFSLIIPYVRFMSQNKPDIHILLDTSAIIDGRVADLIDANLIEGIIIMPRFILKELQSLADSPNTLKSERGRRGIEILNRIRNNPRIDVRIHEGDFPEEKSVDAKLIHLAKNLNAKIFTTDYNLSEFAKLQSVSCVNLNDVTRMLKPTIIPGDIMKLKIVRKGEKYGQGIAYLDDGTMVVVNNGQDYIGNTVKVEIQKVVQTGAGVIIFGDIKES